MVVLSTFKSAVNGTAVVEFVEFEVAWHGQHDAYDDATDEYIDDVDDVV